MGVLSVIMCDLCLFVVATCIRGVLKCAKLDVEVLDKEMSLVANMFSGISHSIGSWGVLGIMHCHWMLFVF